MARSGEELGLVVVKTRADWHGTSPRDRPALTFVEAEIDGQNGVDADSLGSPSGPVLSPDGAHLYVTAGDDDAINAFAVQ